MARIGNPLAMSGRRAAAQRRAEYVISVTFYVAADSASGTNRTWPRNKGPIE
jgi:hypothetical protein